MKVVIEQRGSTEVERYVSIAGSAFTYDNDLIKARVFDSPEAALTAIKARSNYMRQDVTFSLVPVEVPVPPVVRLT